MADQIYGKARQGFGEEKFNLTSDNIKIVLVDADDYTVDIDVDEDLADIPAGARVATSGNLSGKSFTLGVFDADDVVLSSVSGDQAEAIVGYLDTGVEGTSLLIWYADSYTGLPVTPSGGHITVAWDNGANKIFKL